MTERTIRTMLADDHAVVRMGFRLLLEGTTDIKVVAEAESGEEAGDAPCIEEYLNDARVVPPAELRTEIWLPLR